MPSTRADARQNREAILAATERLIATNGVERLRVAEVARAAGVGPGSVYRAFASKGELLLTLLDERERLLQEEIVRGAPPLGPGAPPGERLLAFVQALHDLTLGERQIMLASEHGSPLSRYRTGAYATWRFHVAVLLGELDPSSDAEVLADYLLAPLSAGLYSHLMDERGTDVARLRDALLRTAGAIVGELRPT